jgi:trk system potassium uptake protein TrkA
MEDLIEFPALRPVWSAGHGEVEIYEVGVPAGWDGHPVGDLARDAGCNVIAITQGGRASPPAVDTIMRAGDILHVGASLAAADALRECLAKGASSCS